MVQLKERLQAVASLVMASTDAMKNKTIADIGTDHGYVPIYLVQNKICNKAIAMDIAAGPLERAKKHIREHRLEACIETRQSDGLKTLKPGEAETIVIAGMGGNTIMKILENGREIADAAEGLVLQPQSELEELRRFLEWKGYHILEEDIVCEDSKFYPMMHVKKEPCKALSRLELKYGPRLLERKHPVLKKYLMWQKEEKEKVLMQIWKNALGESREKNECRILEELEDMNMALDMFRKAGQT